MELVEFTNHLQPNMICLKENSFLHYKYVLFLLYYRIFKNVFIYLFIHLLTPVSNLLEFNSLFITFFIYVFHNII